MPIMSGQDYDLPFEWSFGMTATAASKSTLRSWAITPIAVAAYKEAVKRRPGKLITLRQKIKAVG